MIDSILSILAPQTGYVHTLIRRIEDAGKETPEFREAEIQRNLEEGKEKVSVIYNIQGKLVDSNYERHVDIKA